jgi:hypothetical protein
MLALELDSVRVQCSLFALNFSADFLTVRFARKTSALIDLINAAKTGGNTLALLSLSPFDLLGLVIKRSDEKNDAYSTTWSARHFHKKRGCGNALIHLDVSFVCWWLLIDVVKVKYWIRGLKAMQSRACLALMRWRETFRAPTHLVPRMSCFIIYLAKSTAKRVLGDTLLEEWSVKASVPNSAVVFVVLILQGAITEAMARTCRKRGVEISVNTPVASIIVFPSAQLITGRDWSSYVQVEQGRACGVRLPDNSVIKAKTVISGVHPKILYEKLIDKRFLTEDFSRRIKSYKSKSGPYTIRRRLIVHRLIA